jgi:hypothetical protein
MGLSRGCKFGHELAVDQPVPSPGTDRRTHSDYPTAEPKCLHDLRGR